VNGYEPLTGWQPTKRENFFRRHPVVTIVSIISAMIFLVVTGCQAVIDGKAGQFSDNRQGTFVPGMTSAPTGRFTPRGKEVYKPLTTCR
jgi:hypothetical protein